MSFFRVLSVTCLLVAANGSVPTAKAADVSTLQTALALAQENMERAKSKQDASLQAVAQQQKIIAARKKELADETARLEKMQKDARQDEAAVREAQQKVDKAQANLDAAWKGK